jgi:xanthine dehydrogenase accessory factor
MSINNVVLIRGGGDLATGVAIRLHRSGIKVLITELPQPLAVRRAVAFAETVYDGIHSVEGVGSRLIEAGQFATWNEADVIPVLIDPNADILTSFQFPVVVDARLIKQHPTPLHIDVPLHIGLGPGFCAGRDCHAVIETRRSHTMGRVIWDGKSQPDSGKPEGDSRRVLRSMDEGIFISHANIGDHLDQGQLVAEIHSKINNHKHEILSPFAGILRGLIHDGLHVHKGMKIGDVDPRDDYAACFLVSDKALAIGGGVLEAILSRKDIRELLFTN